MYIIFYNCNTLDCLSIRTIPNQSVPSVTKKCQKEPSPMAPFAIFGVDRRTNQC